MRMNKPYVELDPAVTRQARQMDLLTYLKHYEPSELVRVSSNVYCTREHDSLKISNGKWYWWSRGFGGISALEYLIKVKEYDFVEAVEVLTGSIAYAKPPPIAYKEQAPKPLYLPPKNKDCKRVMEYLFRRGIDYQIISDCIAEGIIYESADYHNAVFIGKDKQGAAKYAACRSTLGSDFKRDAAGSDKRYSFRLVANKPATSVHLFESAIDLLSYATYLKCENRDYQGENLLFLSGVYQPKKEIDLTQEQLAEQLYVSRTAISKWESGKGYPNIESLKSISKLFSVSIDDLLSGEELISLAESENRSNIGKIYSLVFGILDLMVLTFLFLPLYGQQEGEFIGMVNLFALRDTSTITTAIYLILPILIAVLGVIELFIEHYDNDKWLNISKICSILLQAFTIVAFISTRHPYAAALMFIFFMIKTLLLIKSSHIK